MDEIIRKLAISQKELLNLQKRLSQNSKLMAKEETQTFIFDLRDYADSLAIVTDPVKDAEAGKIYEAADLATILGEQNALLHQIIEGLKAMVAGTVAVDFFGQKDGELRRTLSSLEGLVELNGLTLQDNRDFQRLLQNEQITLSDPVAEAPHETGKKPGFFKRLFGKNE